MPRRRSLTARDARRLAQWLAEALLAGGTGILVAWMLWPLHCDQSSVGFLAGTPDPNLQLCARRIGGSVGAESAELMAVIAGLVAACALAISGGVAARGLCNIGRRPGAAR